MFKRSILLTLAILMIALPAFAGTGGSHGGGWLWLLGLAPIGLVMNASTLVALQKNFRALYNQAYEAATPAWPKVAMEAPSTGAEENYQWLGDVPGMKEWLDEKTLEKLMGFQYTIRNKDWESTITVDRNDIEDDRLGIYRPKILELGGEARRHPDELVCTIRKAGDSSLCYDGQYFYDTDHVIGKSGTLSNKLTGTGTTVAQIRADAIAARAALRKFKNEFGKPFVRKTGALELLATIPPDLEGQFEDLNNPGPGSTVAKFNLPYAVDPYLADTNDWYMDYVGGFVKPFVFQNRKNPDFVQLDNPNTTEMVFMRKKLAFGVEARYNVGYGLWQYSIKTTNT